MTIDKLNIQCYKTVVFFVNYDVLPSRRCWCTNIYYVTTLTGSRSCELRISPKTARDFVLYTFLSSFNASPNLMPISER